MEQRRRRHERAHGEGGSVVDLRRKLGERNRSVVQLEAEALAAAAAVKEEEMEDEVAEEDSGTVPSVDSDDSEESCTEPSVGSDDSEESGTEPSLSDFESEEDSGEWEVPANCSSSQKIGDRKKLAGNKRTASVPADDDDDRRKKRLRYKMSSVRCEPPRIRETIKLLNASQREKVIELGFGCLFDFNMDSHGSRRLVSWLMDHLDPDTMVLDLGATKQLPITEHVVWCVLGLLRGNMDAPPLKGTLKLNSLKEKLGVPNKSYVDVTYLLRRIRAGGSDRFTMQCIMMIVLAKLLACGSSFYICGHVWSVVQNIDHFGDMNWCKFVVDHLRQSARLWRSGKKITARGCTALLVMYYLDNLDSMDQMRVDTPRVKFFGNGMIKKMEEADMTKGEDGLPRFGTLNLISQRGTCYSDESLESSTHAASAEAFCVRNNRSTMQQPSDTQQIREQQAQEGTQDEESDDGTVAATHDDVTPALVEAPAKIHGEPTVRDVPKEANCEGDQGGSRNSEDSGSPNTPIHDVIGATEAVQLASTFVNDEIRDFMSGNTEPEILESRLSKMVSLLAQNRALVASETRNAELEQQVKDLTEKLCNAEDDLETTRATLRVSQATLLEVQSAVAAINSLALRMSAVFMKLGGDKQSAAGACSSAVTASTLQEAVRLLEDRVFRTEAVSRRHAESLARRSVAFGAAALLCRESRGVDGLRGAVAGDTRRFLRSQGQAGGEFHSLVDQVVHDVQQQHADVPGASSPSVG